MCSGGAAAERGSTWRVDIVEENGDGWQPLCDRTVRTFVELMAGLSPRKFSLAGGVGCLLVA